MYLKLYAKTIYFGDKNNWINYCVLSLLSQNKEDAAVAITFPHFHVQLKKPIKTLLSCSDNKKHL
jgi:hypothetical protein